MGSVKGGEGPTADVQAGEVDVREAELVTSSASGLTIAALPTKPRWIVGRADSCDVVLRDASVSREHAAVFRIKGALWIEDLGSRHGTKVFGTPLARGECAELPVGAAAQLGDATIVLQRRAPRRAPMSLPSTEGPVIQSPKMQALYALLEVVAPSPLSVLLLGETGTGKEVFAESIHRRSVASSGSLVRVNCAGLTGSLLEGELFGYEKGAFTGALAAKPGLFEAASGGTLFLDEIGEMPLDTQAKVLRVIESGEVTRLGSLKPRRIDVRYVAATHRDLNAMIQRGEFRADLFFRLNGFTMTIPPLRERREELLALARYFVARAAQGRAWSLDAGAEAALVRHSWPGNVRELKTVVERALTLAGGEIKAGHLLLDVSEPEVSSGALETPGDLRARRDAWERQHIEGVLLQTGWNQKEASRILGFSTRTLLNKINALGIRRPSKP